MAFRWPQEYAAAAGGGLPAAAREALESCGLEESLTADASQISMHLRLRVYTREERLARKAGRADQAVQSKAAAIAAAEAAAAGEGPAAEAPGGDEVMAEA